MPGVLQGGRDCRALQGSSGFLLRKNAEVSAAFVFY
jgi:hypothetical protein